LGLVPLVEVFPDQAGALACFLQREVRPKAHENATVVLPLEGAVLLVAGRQGYQGETKMKMKCGDETIDIHFVSKTGTMVFDFGRMVQWNTRLKRIFFIAYQRGEMVFQISKEQRLLTYWPPLAGQVLNAYMAYLVNEAIWRED
jgi:hypothetical protein